MERGLLSRTATGNQAYAFQFFMYIIFLHMTDILGQIPTLLNVVFPSHRVTCKSAQRILQTVSLFVPETQIIVNRGGWL